MTASAIIIFLSILFTLVVVHEFGHFLLAKLFKMRVDEFAFGFPPRLLKWKYGETTYSFNLIPLGGYVKIFGENGLDEEDLKNLSEHDRKRLFGNKPWWQRIIVLCGGVAFNILGAIILFTFAFMWGSSIYLDQAEVKVTPFSSREMVLIEVNEKSPLVATGIEPGNVVTRMEADGEAIFENSLDSYSASLFIQKHANSNIAIFYKDSQGFTRQLYAQPKAGIAEGKKILGAKFADTSFKKYSFANSVVQATKTTFAQLTYIFTSLYTLVYDMIWKDAKVEDNLSGPIGLAVMTAKVSEKGLDQIFMFAAMLSLSLAAFNILPIPALDGGRVLFVLFELVRRRKIKATTEQLFHGLGFLALLCLMIFVTYFDIVKALT